MSRMKIDFSKHSFHEIALMLSPYFNEFVLLDTEIFKFVGFGEDSHDYYYIGAPCGSYERADDGLYRISAVCWIEPLKGHISDEYYDMLEYRWSINKGPRPASFVIEEHHIDSEGN